MSKTTLAVILTGIACVSSPALAEQVRYVEEDGVTYKETERVVRRPVTSTRWESRERTVYLPQRHSELRETWRNYRVPVTQMQWVSRMHGRWNPFATPYFTHELVPVTRWETRSELVNVPVAKTEWVEEKRVVQVPVRTQEYVEDRYVSKVAVSASATPTGSRVASRSYAGGVALENDPPRRGWQRVRR